jgi:prophage regulatory protein
VATVNPIKKLIRIADILDRIPYSRMQIYDFIAAGKFPRPVHLGGRAAFWIEDEISEWLQGHIDAERKAA